MKGSEPRSGAWSLPQAAALLIRPAKDVRAHWPLAIGAVLVARRLPSTDVSAPREEVRDAPALATADSR